MSTQVQRIGKYELYKRLASSKTGEVWIAYESQTRNYVTLKIFYTALQADSAEMLQFRQQAARVAALRHPNIAHLLDLYIFPARNPAGPAASKVCLVMEYIEGQTLAEYLQHLSGTGRIRPGPDLVQLFTKISEALAYAHQQDIVHGNLKPTNILLRGKKDDPAQIGEPVLTDFAFLRLLSHTGSTTSPFYLAPEQIRGEAATEQSDSYALGVILYELYTGVLPFRGNRPIAIMMQHLHTPPTPPAVMNPALSSALTSVILRSLAKAPEKRFSSAAALAVSLAAALNVPVPEALSRSVPPSDVAPRNGDKSLSLSSLQVTSEPAAPLGVEPDGQRLAKAKGAAFTSGEELKRHRKRSLGTIYIIALAILALASLGTIGALFLFSPNHQSAPSNALVGHAFFLNSGQLSASSPQGINDELQIDLSNIPAPPSGKSYFAWLLADKTVSESLPLSLGSVNVEQGALHFLYRGDAQHTNLLGVVSRFLITVDDAKHPTSNPLLDTTTWRYFAEIPALPNPGDALHFSMLDHLRHLLVESPELRIRGLHGGLAFWLVKNVASVSTLASSARDAWHAQDIQTIRQQVISILDYIDGANFASADLPRGTPLLADTNVVQVPLLGPAPNNPDPPGYVYTGEVPPGFVYLLGEHMNGAIQSSQTTADQRQLAIQINKGIDGVKQLLQQVYQDAKQLLAMSGAQLLQTSALSILNDLATQAQNAYTGQLDPASGQTQGGAIWIYGNVQRLATFDVRQYVAPTH